MYTNVYFLDMAVDMKANASFRFICEILGGVVVKKRLVNNQNILLNSN